MIDTPTEYREAVFECLPPWADRSLATALALQRASSGTDAPVHAAICASGGWSDHIATALQSLYANPVEVHVNSRRSPTVVSEPEEPDAVILRAADEVALRTVERLSDDTEYAVDGPVPFPSTIPLVIVTTPEDGTFIEEQRTRVRRSSDEDVARAGGHGASLSKFPVDESVLGRLHLALPLGQELLPTTGSDEGVRATLDTAWQDAQTRGIQRAAENAANRSSPRLTDDSKDRLARYCTRIQQQATDALGAAFVSNTPDAALALAETAARVDEAGAVGATHVTTALNTLQAMHTHLGFDADGMADGGLRPAAHKPRAASAIRENICTAVTVLGKQSDDGLAGEAEVIELVAANGHHEADVERVLDELVQEDVIVEGDEDGRYRCSKSSRP